ncbi:MAG: hypothetical protein HQM09_12545 [Candidatus Riflebacteria bacterium]|nr:hypothetical protein [Candidatus Riflebacteria bacterium]
MSLFRRWWIFLQERFELFGTTLAIIAFFTANAIIALEPVEGVRTFTSIRSLSGLALMWLVFLHMRLFDEARDYQYDRKFYPTRPLARGLISLDELWKATLITIIIEVALAANLGWHVLIAYVLLLSFTLLMRMEFFIGDWLRSNLELYAISQTFSASIMGGVIGSLISGKYLISLPDGFGMFAFSNWFIFTVFELSRKTNGREEEREGIETYSLRLNPGGAIALITANLLVGVGFCFWACASRFGVIPMGVLWGNIMLTFIVTISGLFYMYRPNRFEAEVYRTVVTFFFLAYNMIIVAGVYWR